MLTVFMDVILERQKVNKQVQSSTAKSEYVYIEENVICWCWIYMNSFTGVPEI